MSLAIRGRPTSCRQTEEATEKDVMNTRSSLPKMASGEPCCVYCAVLADSKDHAPPKCLMLPPLPSNLMTLPACKKCNNGFSFDENVVRAFISFIGRHPHLVQEREPGEWLERTLQRNPKINQILADARQADGNFMLKGELLDCVRRVFFKTVQGMYYGLYDRVVSNTDLFLLRVEDQRQTTVEKVLLEIRPNPLEDITDKPLPEISPHSWHTRQPVLITQLVDPKSGQTLRRVFRLVRETPVEWVRFQEGTFGAAFVKCDDACACVMDLWQTLIVTVRAPWPGDRGPIRRGKKNPLSRDHK